MLTDPAAEYSHWSDDELLHLASERHSLTAEGVAALDAELRRRNLTESDRVEYQKFVKRQEHREWKRGRRWKIPTPGLKTRPAWRDILEAFAAMAVISLAYIALPSRYHLSPDWHLSGSCNGCCTVKARLPVPNRRTAFRERWVPHPL